MGERKRCIRSMETLRQLDGANIYSTTHQAVGDRPPRVTVCAKARSSSWAWTEQVSLQDRSCSRRQQMMLPRVTHH